MTTTIVFQGANKLIEIHEDAETSITVDVQTDVYSAWKTWVKTGNNAKYLSAMRTVGGDPTVGVKSIAPSFFLMNGWKIKPVIEANTVINLEGNLFVDDIETYGSNIAVPPDGSYTVQLNLSTTSDAIQITSGSGVTQQDKQDIADLVDGSAVLAKEATVGVISKINAGRWKIADNQLTIYDDDGETPLQVFNLYNADGQPAMSRVRERVPA